MIFTTAALPPALNAGVMALGLVCILGLFLALTQQIETWLNEQKERDDRSGS